MHSKLRRYSLEIIVFLFIIIAWQWPALKSIAAPEVMDVTSMASPEAAEDITVSPDLDDSAIYLPAIFSPLLEGSWQIVTAANTPTGRHENGYVQVGGKFYLIGGRGIKPVEVFDPVQGLWHTASLTPVEMHHFQAVVYNDLIYILGAFTGPFPYEQGIGIIYIYNPAADTWHIGGGIPGNRQRGGAGAVAYQDKIYVVGGIVGGHGPHATAVPWFDVFDPETGSWTTLPDAPHVRDHFNAAVHDDKLYAVGGRNTGTDNFANNTVGAVDIYDFTLGSWSTLESPAGDLPTQRAGSMTAVLGNEIIVVGGEGFGQAWAETEALNVVTHQWRSLSSLIQARHGSQLAVCNDGLYVVAGAGAQGGAPELTSQEVFFMDQAMPCTP